MVLKVGYLFSYVSTVHIPAYMNARTSVSVVMPSVPFSLFLFSFSSLCHCWWYQASGLAEFIYGNYPLGRFEYIRKSLKKGLPAIELSLIRTSTLKKMNTRSMSSVCWLSFFLFPLAFIFSTVNVFEMRARIDVLFLNFWIGFGKVLNVWTSYSCWHKLLHYPCHFCGFSDSFELMMKFCIQRLLMKS